MKRFIDVHKGEVMAGQGEVVLHSDSKEPCLVIVARDPDNKIGGLAHAVFMSGRLDKKWHSSAIRDAAGAIDEMIKDMTLIGASRENIEVSLVAGENVPHDKNDPEYFKNLDSTIDLLKQKRVKLVEHPEKDIGPMHVALDVNTGTISYD